VPFTGDLTGTKVCINPGTGNDGPLISDGCAATDRRGDGGYERGTTAAVRVSDLGRVRQRRAGSEGIRSWP
jgi:predicted Rdx family selenoprotein